MLPLPETRGVTGKRLSDRDYFSQPPSKSHEALKWVLANRMNRGDVLHLQGKQPKEEMCLLHFLSAPVLDEQSPRGLGYHDDLDHLWKTNCWRLTPASNCYHGQKIHLVWVWKYKPLKFWSLFVTSARVSSTNTPYSVWNRYINQKLQCHLILSHDSSMCYGNIDLGIRKNFLLKTKRPIGISYGKGCG